MSKHDPTDHRGWEERQAPTQEERANVAMSLIVSFLNSGRDDDAEAILAAALKLGERAAYARGQASLGTCPICSGEGPHGCICAGDNQRRAFYDAGKSDGKMEAVDILIEGSHE